MSRRTLYAVLAGINDYPPPVTALRGCVHDVQVLSDFLGQQESFDRRITVMTNAQVTKHELVEAWRNVLSTAQKGDVVFLYYSGHGTRENADVVFNTLEQDNALECLVCYDSVQYIKGSFEFQLLADKEIHYLISQTAPGVHVATMFDCCHSGGITRNMLLAGEGDVRARRYIPTSRMGMKVPKRKWSQFIFGAEIPHDKVEREGWLAIVPQKPHITMSACQNDESAFEKDGKGIFTTNLLETLLRAGSGITYFDLHARVRMLTQNQFRQTPEVYAIRGHEGDLLKGFLDHTAVQSAFNCTCTFHPDYGWIIDLGAMHGVSHYSDPVVVEADHEKLEAEIDKIHGHFTQIKFRKAALRELDEKLTYTAQITRFTGVNTTFFLAPSDSNAAFIQELKQTIEAKAKDAPAPFILVDDRTQAQYLIVCESQVYICINDEATRPVTAVELTDPSATERTIRAMAHIAQWEYVRSLFNPDYSGTDYPVQIRLYRIGVDGKKQEVHWDGETVFFDYDGNSESGFGGQMKVEVRNHGCTKYYCSLLYLSNTFQIYGNMLDGIVVGLGPSESVWVYNGDVIELDLEKHVLDFNFEYSVFYLKLIANTKPFAVEMLEQSPLPPPTRDAARGIQAAQRGLKTREEGPVETQDWFTRTICFKGRNPNYQSKSE